MPHKHKKERHFTSIFICLVGGLPKSQISRASNPFSCHVSFYMGNHLTHPFFAWCTPKIYKVLILPFSSHSLSYSLYLPLHCCSHHHWAEPVLWASTLDSIETQKEGKMVLAHIARTHDLRLFSTTSLDSWRMVEVDRRLNPKKLGVVVVKVKNSIQAKNCVYYILNNM